MRPNLAEHGAQHFPGAAKPLIGQLTEFFDGLPLDAGVRLAELGSLAQPLSSSGSVGQLVSTLVGTSATPVRAIAFDKSDNANWALGWHQDRTICVQNRVETAGFGPWTIKQGLHHVEPPFHLLMSMITIRIHLDAVDSQNAPLKVALRSHQMGRIAEAQIKPTIERCEILACLADVGDVWIYSTPILHASDRANSGLRRRVLQVDFSAQELPGQLEWLF